MSWAIRVARPEPMASQRSACASAMVRTARRRWGSSEAQASEYASWKKWGWVTRGGRRLATWFQAVATTQGSPPYSQARGEGGSVGLGQGQRFRIRRGVPEAGQVGGLDAAGGGHRPSSPSWCWGALQ